MVPPKAMHVPVYEHSPVGTVADVPQKVEAKLSARRSLQCLTKIRHLNKLNIRNVFRVKCTLFHNYIYFKYEAVD